MKKTVYGLIVVLLLLSPVAGANAQVNIGFGFPNLSIGINLPMYPTLAPVPGYPVYYAPEVDGNYFYYDSMYWVYQNDNWYTSSWYNGPWAFVEPYAVPLYILRVPVSYYRQPPVYFRGWQSNAPPRWGQHWGNSWEQRRGGWDKWNRKAVPARAPLPAYQRQYSGDRYPGAEQQHSLRNQSYRYQPKERAVREHLKQQGQQRAPAAVQRGKQESPPTRTPAQAAPQHPAPRQQGAPANQHTQPPQRGGEHVENPAPVQQPQQQRANETRDQRQQAPRVQEQKSQKRDEGRESDRGGRGEGRDKEDDRGRGR
jgi:hypothetical protein